MSPLFNTTSARTRVVGLVLPVLLAASGGGPLATLQAQTGPPPSPPSGSPPVGSPAPGGTAPGTAPGTAQPSTVIIGDDTEPPAIWFTPEGGTVTSSAPQITIHWCDDVSLVTSSRTVTVDGQAVSVPYAAGTYPGCGRYGTSVLTLALSPGVPRTLAASIRDNAGNIGNHASAYVFGSAGLAVSLVSPNRYRDPAQCALDCGEVVVRYTTPAYVSADVPRAVTLVYRSGRARPMPVVEVDVTTAPAGTTRLGLALRATNGTFVPLTHGATEVVRGYAAGTTNRLAAQLDGTGLNWLMTQYTAVVTAYDASGAALGSTPVDVRVLVDDLNGASSPYGAGWGIAGLQQLRAVSDGGLVIVDGDGSIGYWGAGTTVNGTTTFASPPGDVTTVTFDGASYRRRYPDGTTVTFNGWGSATAVTDRRGAATQFTYVKNDWLSTITDPAGQVISVVYRGASGGTSEWRDSSLARISDGRGREVFFGVDAANDLRAVNEPFGATNDVRRETHRWYYGTGVGAGAVPHRLTVAEDWRGEQTLFTYDATGSLGALTPPALITGGARHLLTTQIASWAAAVLPPAGQGTLAAPAAALLDTAARARVTTPDGLTTALHLDRWGAADRVEGPGGTVATATRDAEGRVTRTVDARGQAVTAWWNATRRWLVDSTYDAGAKVRTRYTYDATRDYALQAVLVDGVEQQRIWTRVDGRMDSVRVGGPGQKATRYRYLRSWDVRPDTVIDPRGHVTILGYEPSGLRNTTSVTTAGGTSYVTRDQFGRDSVTMDPTGRRAGTEYDLLNRVVATVDAAGQRTTIDVTRPYGAAVTDATGQTYAEAHNALGLVDTATDPAGRTSAVVYDAAGRVSRTTNRRGQTVVFGYDPQLGHLTSRSTPDGADATYGRDALGRVRWASTAASLDSVFTDSLGRDTLAVHYVRALGMGMRYWVSAKYDSLGRRTQVVTQDVGGPSTIAEGLAYNYVHYGYDPASGLLTSMSVAGATTQLGYNEDALPTTITWPTGVTVRDSLTPTHALGSRRYTGTNASGLDAAFGRAYGYDGAGRAIARFNATRGLVRRYSYDAVGRLVAAQDAQTNPAQCTSDYGNPTGAQIVGDAPATWQCAPGADTPLGSARTWAWDAVGNPVSSSPYFWAEPGTGNQLAWGNNQNHGFDADGNLTLSVFPPWASPTGDWMTTRRLSWNSVGQLTGAWRTATDGSGRTDSVTFAYDGWGRRIAKRNGTTGVTTYFIWDGDDLIAEADGTGRLVAQYAYYPGVDQPHSVRVSPAPGVPAVTYHYATERPGHVIGLVGASGALAARYAYQPFGVADTVQENLGGWSNRLRFGAREYDAETGLYFHRARYYDPELRRFVSQDPIGLAGGVNWYAYAGNDPVNNTDPTGLRPCGAEYLASGYESRQDDEGRWWCVYTGGHQLAPVRVDGGGGASGFGGFSAPSAPTGGFAFAGAAGAGSPKSNPHSPPTPSAPKWRTPQCMMDVGAAGINVVGDLTFFTGVGAAYRAGRIAFSLGREASALAYWSATAPWLSGRQAAVSEAAFAARGLREIASQQVAEGYAMNVVGNAQIQRPASDPMVMIGEFIPGISSIISVNRALDSCF